MSSLALGVLTVRDGDLDEPSLVASSLGPFEIKKCNTTSHLEVTDEAY